MTGEMTTKRIAGFIVETGYHQIPEEAITIAKQAILDSLGTSLAGAEQPTAEIVTEYVKQIGGKPEAGVITKGFKVPAPLAALANGTMAHVLDYDDWCLSWLGHPTVVIMPTVLSLGEKGKLPGKAILEAYILGYEVGAKIKQGLGFRHYEAGWHTTATVGTMAAAAAAAKIMRLDVQEVRMALGIAASLSCGLRQNFGTMTKSFHAGNAAQNGMMAALLAKKGFTANESILEAPVGYGKTFSQECNLPKMTQGLGSPFAIVYPGVIFKSYPSCGATHVYIDAILYLVRKHNISADRVVKVECQTGSFLPTDLFYHHPTTGLEAKFSLEYCMAIALLDREVRSEQFTDERVSSHDVQDLIPKVKYVHPEGVVGAAGLRLTHAVSVTLQDGTEFWHEFAVPRGDPSNPLTQEELVAKFRECAHRALSTQDMERCVELVSNLESLKDVSPLMDILTSARK